MNNAEKNVVLNDQEIAARKTVLASYPRRLIVTLSTKCNAQCIMCEVRHMAWDIPQKTLREIESLFPVLECIAWQGGEVFYIDSFREVFDEALKHDHLRQTIVTNGLLINEQLAEKLAGANLELAVSVDGTTRETYEKIRHGSSFDKIQRNLALLREARTRVKSHMELRLHTVIMRSNYQQMDSFMEFAHAYGFNAVHMMPIWGPGSPEENIFARPDAAIEQQVREKLQIVSRQAKEYGIEFLNSLPIKEEKENKAQQPAPEKAVEKAMLLCHLPWKEMTVDPCGGVRPGCSCPKKIGSVENSSLSELWNSEPMQKYREIIVRNEAGWCNPQCLNENIPKRLRGMKI